jgi:hypothetical protein
VQAARLAAGSGDARARELAAGDLQRQARELSRLGRELKP